MNWLQRDKKINKKKFIKPFEEPFEWHSLARNHRELQRWACPLTARCSLYLSTFAGYIAVHLKFLMERIRDRGLSPNVAGFAKLVAPVLVFSRSIRPIPYGTAPRLAHERAFAHAATCRALQQPHQIIIFNGAIIKSLKYIKFVKYSLIRVRGNFSYIIVILFDLSNWI